MLDYYWSAEESLLLRTGKIFPLHSRKNFCLSFNYCMIVHDGDDDLLHNRF